MQGTTDLIEFLHAPQTVARFQRFCGLEILKTDECLHNGQDAQGQSSVNGGCNHSQRNNTSDEDCTNLGLTNNEDSLKQVN